MTQDEFEEWIEGDFAEHRSELRTEQVTPVYDIWRSAYLRVRPEFVAQAGEVHASFSSWVQSFLQLRTGSEILRSYAGVEPDALYIDLYHDSDRTHAGYANIYRGIKALAPYVEDARFFITELYDSFVDEYSQALECFDEALSLGAGSGTRQARALVSFSAGRDAEALAHLQRIPAEHRNRLTLQLSGHLLARAGKASAAKEAFDAALQRTPKAPGQGRLNPDAEALFRTGRADRVLPDQDVPRVLGEPLTPARAGVLR